LKGAGEAQEKLSIVHLRLLILRMAFSTEMRGICKEILAELMVSKVRAMSSLRIGRGNKDLFVISIISSLKRYSVVKN
jgi:hypothetical protein